MKFLLILLTRIKAGKVNTSGSTPSDHYTIVQDYKENINPMGMVPSIKIPKVTSEQVN